MRSAALCLFTCVALVGIKTSGAAEQSKSDNAAKADYVIFAPEEFSEFRSSLIRIIATGRANTRVIEADSLEMAAESDAEVVVVILPGLERPKFIKKTLDALKPRKIIGIGKDTVLLFGELGLELYHNNAAYAFSDDLVVTIPKSELLGEPAITEQFRLTIPPEPRDQPRTVPDAVRLTAHPRGENADVFDVIARVPSDAHHALMARQGNCVLIGVSVPPDRWTQPFKQVVRETCHALHRRKLEEFSVARREITKPGTYEFNLAGFNDPDELGYRNFYFRFAEASRLTARLQGDGSELGSLLFLGEKERRPLWTHVHAKDGQPPKLTKEISSRDIEGIGDRHWLLRVANHNITSVNFKLTITVEKLE